MGTASPGKGDESLRLLNNTAFGQGESEQKNNILFRL